MDSMKQTKSSPNSAAILRGLGGGLEGAGYISSGNSQYAASKYNARQLRTQASYVRGAASRKGAEEERQGKLAQSALIARAAASGGGVSADPTILDLYGDIGAEGRRRALTEIYEGQVAGRRIDTQAANTLYEGKQARTAGYIGAATSILGAGVSTLYSKYADGGFKTEQEIADEKYPVANTVGWVNY